LTAEAYERYSIDLAAYDHMCQTRPCFICAIVARHPDYPAHIVYEDEIAIAFLDKYPTLYGYTLVAPREHREQVSGDFSIDDYLALQRRVYWVAEAVRREVEAERVYVLSLGSNQGNAHVHWHVAPLPPGVSYQKQQMNAIGLNRGVLRIPEENQASLALRLRRRVEQLREQRG
jgi:diadenosine tetraphosphate (Ap4A) HIT family hydrolase